MSSSNKLLVLLGPTASGKTQLAVQLAVRLNGEIISADSRQVYKGLDIGTGKDLHSYTLDDKKVPYHLIDTVESGEKYNVHQFNEDFSSAYLDITRRGKLAILCGGTGMYIHQLLQPQPYTAVPIDETLRDKLRDLNKDVLIDKLNGLPIDTNSVDLSSIKRIIRAIEVGEYLKLNTLPPRRDIKFQSLVIGLCGDRPLLRKRIYKRLVDRLKNGLIEEGIKINKNGLSFEMMRYYGLEYKFLADYLEGKMLKEEMIESLSIQINQYSKRQETYFRKMEKDGIAINWLDFTDSMEKNLSKSLNLAISNLDLKL